MAAAAAAALLEEGDDATVSVVAVVAAGAVHAAAARCQHGGGGVAGAAAGALTAVLLHVAAVMVFLGRAVLALRTAAARHVGGVVVQVGRRHGASLFARHARRHLVDAVVDEHHDAERRVEGAHRRVDLVAERLADGAHAVGEPRPAPAEQRRQADDGRQRPDGQDHRQHPARRALRRVLEGARDDEVAVDADDAQVEDGGGAEEDVERRPRVAERLAEHPPAEALLRRGERHDEHGDEQVGDGERHDQQVGRRAQLVDDEDGEADERVAHHRADDDHRAGDDDQHRLPHLVAVRGGARRRRRVAVREGRVVRRPVATTAAAAAARIHQEDGGRRDGVVGGGPRVTRQRSHRYVPRGHYASA